MLFRSQSRLQFIVTESMIYLAGLQGFTDLSVCFAPVTQCPLLGDGLIHLVLFAWFLLISKQLQAPLICLSHVFPEAGALRLRGEMQAVLGTAFLGLPQAQQGRWRPSHLPSDFIPSTFSCCVYLAAASLPIAESEAACQQQPSEEVYELF